MKKNTKKLIITGGVVAIVFSIIFAFRKKKEEEEGSYNGKKEKLIGDGSNENITFKKLQKEFKNNDDDLQLLNVAERILRLESANFTSNIYKKTNGGGFLAVTKNYPFGFVAPVPVWETFGKPKNVYSSSNGLDYIIFPDVEVGIRSIMALVRSYHEKGSGTGNYHPGDKDYLNKIKSFSASKLFTPSYENNIYLT